MNAKASQFRDLEIQVLRALCAGAASAASENTALQRLRSYSWQCPEHQVIFDALTCLSQHPRAAIREKLPAQATRMGFPDVDWPEYLGGVEDKHGLRQLVDHLLCTATASERT